MEFVDRVSAYPGRYIMPAEDGSTSYVILERADDPTVVGTPLNAETFNAMVAEFISAAGGTMTGNLKTHGLVLTSGTDYGDTLPPAGVAGRLFFKKVSV